MLGIALCGGGIKCVAHLGVLQVLRDHGVTPTFLAGSSMGAVVAAISASGLDLKEAAEEFSRVRMSDVFLGGLPLPGLDHGRRFRRLLTRLFGSQRMEDLRIPLLVPACDLITGTTHWMDQGSLADALYASCALPGFFSPLPTGRMLLADGCLSEPLPVTELKKRGVEQIVGVHFPAPSGTDRYRTVPLIARSIGLLLNGLSRPAFETVDLLIQPEVGQGSPVRWNQQIIRCYVEAGRTAALRNLSALSSLGVGVSPESYSGTHFNFKEMKVDNGVVVGGA